MANCWDSLVDLAVLASGVAGVDALKDDRQLPVAEGDEEVELGEVTAGALGVAGLEPSAICPALARIDDYYADQDETGDGVASQLVRQLSDPQPADRSVIDELPSYRRLRRRWSDWSAVTDVLGDVAARMVSQ